MLVENSLTSSFEDRESALISRRYGVPGSFILLLYWNWCSYRLEMGVSESLWSVVKDVKPLLYMMWNGIGLWIQWRGNVFHLELIWGTPIYFAFLKWPKCSSLVVTRFLEILFSSIREIKVLYVFDWEHRSPRHVIQWNRASSCGEEEVSWVLSSSAGTWCIFSSYGRDGHLKLGFFRRSQDSCLVMTVTSGT